MDVSIIIVNYNTSELLKNCIHSIYSNTTGINYEIIVSDNASVDNSIQMISELFPDVHVIKNDSNLGFGAANNRALNIATGKYIFYLNSDTVLLNNAVKIFYDYFEKNMNENIGALGSNLLNTKGEIIHSYGSFDSFNSVFVLYIKVLITININSFLKLFHLKQYSRSSKISYLKYVGEVDYITGADLFLKNDEYAYFDEQYFLYSEESDLQWKLKEINKKRILIDGPQIIHLEGGSDGGKKSVLEHFRSFSRIQQGLSRIKFIKKNCTKKGAFFLKYFLLFIWLSPAIFPVTKKYMKELKEI